jgi:hypothetical protein
MIITTVARLTEHHEAGLPRLPSAGVLPSQQCAAKHDTRRLKNEIAIDESLKRHAPPDRAF